MSGTVAGVAITLVGHPFDTVKVRLQTQAVTGPGVKFSGAWSCFRETLRNEGIRGVYRGMSGPMATAPLVNAIVFSCYEQGLSVLRAMSSKSGNRNDEPEKDLTLAQIALAGGWAGLVNCAIVGPIELVKSRLQVQYEAKGMKRELKGPWDVVRLIYAKQGVKGLFAGMNITIAREIPAYMGQFYAYEWMKRSLTPRGKTTADLGAGQLMLAGGMAGIAAWICSYPQDVIKSRIQVQPLGQVRYPPWMFDGGALACAKEIFRERGLRSFWTGFGACAARALPANAVGFLAYEITSNLLWS